MWWIPPIEPVKKEPEWPVPVRFNKDAEDRWCAVADLPDGDVFIICDIGYDGTWAVFVGWPVPEWLVRAMREGLKGI